MYIHIGGVLRMYGVHSTLHRAIRLKFFVVGIFIYIAVVMNRVEVALLSGIDVIPWRDLHLQVSRTRLSYLMVA